MTNIQMRIQVPADRLDQCMKMAREITGAEVEVDRNMIAMNEFDYDRGP